MSVEGDGGSAPPSRRAHNETEKRRAHRLNEQIQALKDRVEVRAGGALGRLDAGGTGWTCARGPDTT